MIIIENLIFFNIFRTTNMGKSPVSQITAEGK